MLKKLKSLLRKLKVLAPVPSFTPKSTWPDILDPYQYQNKLMRQYEQSNLETYEKMMNAIASGSKLTLFSEVAGPYTTSKIYTFDNHHTYSVTCRSSLHWIEPLMVI